MSIKITKREYEVLIRLTKTNIDIADEINTSERNVIRLVSSLCKKLNVSTRTSVIIKAMKLGLVSLYNILL